MSLFSKKHTGSDSQVAIDIGSGSIGIVLLNNDPSLDNPVLWSYREYTTVSEKYKQPTQKLIQTTLLEVMLRLQNEGLAVLQEKQLPPLSSMKVCVSAPWAYTFSKKVLYKQEHTFSITSELLDELYTSVTEDIAKTITSYTNEHEGLQDLEIVQNEPSCIIANGYQLRNWSNSTTKQLQVHYVLVAIHKYLRAAISEVHEKILPNTQLQIVSYAQLAAQGLHKNYPSSKEAAIMHVTADASELIVIRNGLLHTVSYIPTGYRSLFEQLAAEMNVPKGEADTHLKEAELPEKWRVANTFTQYVTDMKELVAQTGDSLSIPKTIFLDAPMAYNDFFTEQIIDITKQTTGLQHTVHPLFPGGKTSTQCNDMSLAVTNFKYHT